MQDVHTCCQSVSCCVFRDIFLFALEQKELLSALSIYCALRLPSPFSLSTYQKFHSPFQVISSYSNIKPFLSIPAIILSSFPKLLLSSQGTLACLTFCHCLHPLRQWLALFFGFIPVVPTNISQKFREWLWVSKGPKTLLLPLLWWDHSKGAFSGLLLCVSLDVFSLSRKCNDPISSEEAKIACETSEGLWAEPEFPSEGYLEGLFIQTWPCEPYLSCL